MYICFSIGQSHSASWYMNSTSLSVSSEAPSFTSLFLFLQYIDFFCVCSFVYRDWILLYVMGTL